MKIINVYNSIATTHDFQMTKDSNIIDSLNELTTDEKEFNKKLSSQRVKIEHTNRTIKIFRIMKETYRNHQKDMMLS